MRKYYTTSDEIDMTIKDRFDTGRLSISLGNTKLGKIPNFNLAPIKSCVNCADCKNDCYANKYYRQYPDVKIAYDSNLLIAKYKLDKLKEKIIEFLSKNRRKPIKSFRIHSSGDFFSQAYFEAWLQIARLFPSITFFSYTKNYNLDVSNLPDNFILRYSVFYNSDGKHSLNVTKAYTIQVSDVETVKENGGFICPCDCQNCRFCSDIDTKLIDVYFPLH